jgi:hypothetical protein
MSEQLKMNWLHVHNDRQQLVHSLFNNADYNHSVTQNENTNGKKERKKQRKKERKKTEKEKKKKGRKNTEESSL